MMNLMITLAFLITAMIYVKTKRKWLPFKYITMHKLWFTTKCPVWQFSLLGTIQYVHMNTIFKKCNQMKLDCQTYMGNCPFLMI